MTEFSLGFALLIVGCLATWGFALWGLGKQVETLSLEDPETVQGI